MERIRQSEHVYFENLDGLRFFAFLLVFISHAALFIGFESQSSVYAWLKYNVLVNGDLGVSFFFVLSGFLITYLLLKEQIRTGTISLKKFYARRVLRIWPVYAIVVFMGFVVVPYLLSYLGGVSVPFDAVPPQTSWPWYAFFLANFSMAMHQVNSIPTDILWSVSVEEQFYLVWPWLVLSVPRRHLPKILFSILFLASLFRFTHAYDPDALAYSTLSVMADLAVGCLMAWLFAEGYLEKYVHMSRSFIGTVYVSALVLSVGRHAIFGLAEIHSTWMGAVAVAVPILLSLMFAVIIFEQNEGKKSFFKVGRLHLISKLGVISYGLYAYHPAVFVFVLAGLGTLGLPLFHTSVWQFVWTAFLLLLSTIIFAHVSYTIVEKWFLKYKPLPSEKNNVFSL